MFKIIKVLQTNPVTYLLKEDSRGESIAGGFYEYEMYSVTNLDVHLVENGGKKENEIYVKWLGFDNSHNSWIKTIHT